jgi:hypothetical protein
VTAQVATSREGLSSGRLLGYGVGTIRVCIVGANGRMFPSGGRGEMGYFDFLIFEHKCLNYATIRHW